MQKIAGNSPFADPEKDREADIGGFQKTVMAPH